MRGMFRLRQGFGETDARLTRRQFGMTVGATLSAMSCGAACLVATRNGAAGDGRFTARPKHGVTTTLVSGALGLGSGERDGVIQMPTAAASGAVPLLVFLHGATQNGAGMLRRIGPAADRAGVAVFAPDSRGTTWDAIRGGFGDDVVFLNRALEHVFSRLDVDPARIALGGFSDGASYAISLGLANGDLFPRVAAFSPGFVISAEPHGKPRFFISHGTADQILPIAQCSRVIVPRLKSMGYDVTFREFEGRHEMPAPVADEGLQWIAARSATPPR
jgi:phospholipase/carboxylesterase